MDEKRIAERVARSVTANIAWTGSTYEDADKAGDIVETMGKDMKSIVAMIVEGASDLEDDFKSNGDTTYRKYASDLQRNAKKIGDEVEKALWKVQRQLLAELKGQIDHLSDTM